MAIQPETWRFPVIDAVFCFAILAGVSNFGYHALQGDNGLFAIMAVEAEERALAQDLAALTAERIALENIADRLAPRSLDLDLVDETARAGLGLMRPDERTLR